MTTLVITPEGEEALYLQIDSQPTVSFTDSNIVITANDQELLFPLSCRVEFTFSDDDSGIQQLGATPPMSLILNDKTLTISTLQANEQIFIFDLYGTLVHTYRADNDGSAVIDLAHDAKGLYLLKTNRLNYKYILR
jgi:hypothetical protein